MAGKMDVRRKPLGVASGHNLYQLASFNPGVGVSLLQQAARRTVPAASHVLSNRAAMVVGSSYRYLSGLWQAAKEKTIG